MSKLSHFVLPGQPQLVELEGPERHALFYREEDYWFYLYCLRVASDCHFVDVHAYVLLDDHVQLVSTPRKSQGISKMIQATNIRYDRYLEARYRPPPVPWPVPYQSTPIDSDSYVLRCCRYVEFAPVRAGVAHLPQHYRWSSYRHHAQGFIDPLVTHHRGYCSLAATPGGRCRRYCQLCDRGMTPAELADIRESAKKGWVIGDDRFRRQDASAGRQIAC